MIYVTGDCHAKFDKFDTEAFPQQKDMTKDDFAMICGDFGGVWAKTPEQEHGLDWLEEKPFTTLFVDGNHENYDLLATYPVQDWHGGKVQFIRPSVIHLMRGQVYDIKGKTFFTMGGASSHDISGGILDPNDPNFEKIYFLARITGQMVRVNHYSWWKEELPSEEEYETARKALDKVNWNIDYILTHCAPTSMETILGHGKYQSDHLTDILDEVYQKAKFRHWYFGHYHKNTRLNEKMTLLYGDIVPLEE